MAHNRKAYRKAKKGCLLQAKRILRVAKPLIGTGRNGHVWAICPDCGPYVQCACGNNCCNGGSGRSIGRNDCDCDDAYELQNEGYRWIVKRIKLLHR